MTFYENSYLPLGSHLISIFGIPLAETKTKIRFPAAFSHYQQQQVTSTNTVLHGAIPSLQEEREP